MKPSLQLRQSQQLALTPQLQQSIRLLQLSTLELNQELEQILAENPLLERLDDPFADSVRIAPNGSIDAGSSIGSADSAGDASSGSTSSQADSPQQAEGGSDAYDEGGSDYGGDGDRGTLDWGGEARGPGTEGDDDERDYPQLAGTSESLSEHLQSQLAGTGCSVRDRALVTLLIEELDPDGYLRTPLEEILESLPAELELEPEELSAALKLLQSFDPAGVGAGSVSECLLLQLAAIPVDERPEKSIFRLAALISRDYLDLLAARDFVRLKRLLRCDEDALREAQQVIQSLSPRPGSAFSGEAAAIVVPDVIIRRTRDGWQAVLNPDVMPKLRINDVYAQVLKRNRSAAGGNLSAQLQEARWLVKNVQQRFETIQRVAQAVTDRQKAFFTHGAVAMRPLVLREIAEELGLHESTISRVTTQKFMMTPFGTFEIKYFFGSHVATDTGGTASSTAIRAVIKQLISEEDHQDPLPDSRIAELLGEQGIVVARRTVAKYREALQIAPVAQRRAL